MTNGIDDIFFSHDTWSAYFVSFIRVAKTYAFHFGFDHTDSQTVTFSSYPATFFSLDDFYIIHNTLNGASAKLAILETTYNIFNEELTEFIDGVG